MGQFRGSTPVSPTDPLRRRPRGADPGAPRPQWWPPIYFGHRPYRWSGTRRYYPGIEPPEPPPSGVGNALLQEDGFLILQENGSAILLGVAPGAFNIDFTGYPDGEVPAETGLRDAFLSIPDSQDEMGIRDGLLAVVDFRGPDQSFTSGGGRRGLLWRETVTLTDNVYGLVRTDFDVDGFLPGAPCLHVVLDDPDLAISTWFLPPPYSWAELGAIGWEQEAFAYMDLAPNYPVPGPTDDVFIRSVGGFVSVEVNGDTILGPCPIPAGLLGSSVHGVQMDVSEDDHEGLGITPSVEVGFDDTPLGTRSAPLTPAIGTAVETASSTTINIPYVGGISAGDMLIAIIATKNGGTFTIPGWDNAQITGNFGVAGGIQIGVYTKEATGSEAGNLTVTKSTAGIMAGVMTRATGARIPQSSGRGNTPASTSIPTDGIRVFGPNRTWLWLAATSIDTNIFPPAEFIPLSAGVTGGQAIRLSVNVIVAETHSDFPESPFNAYETEHFPDQVGTCASAATSAAGWLILNPEFG